MNVRLIQKTLVIQILSIVKFDEINYVSIHRPCRKQTLDHLKVEFHFIINSNEVAIIGAD